MEVWIRELDAGETKKECADDGDNDIHDRYQLPIYNPKLSSEILHVIDFSVLLGCIHRLHYLLVGHVLLLSTKGFSLGAKIC